MEINAFGRFCHFYVEAYHCSRTSVVLFFFLSFFFKRRSEERDYKYILVEIRENKSWFTDSAFIKIKRRGFFSDCSGETSLRVLVNFYEINIIEVAQDETKVVKRHRKKKKNLDLDS